MWCVAAILAVVVCFFVSPAVAGLCVWSLCVSGKHCSSHGKWLVWPQVSELLEWKAGKQRIYDRAPVVNGTKQWISSTSGQRHEAMDLSRLQQEKFLETKKCRHCQRLMSGQLQKDCEETTGKQQPVKDEFKTQGDDKETRKQKEDHLKEERMELKQVVASRTQKRQWHRCRAVCNNRRLG